MNKLHRKCSYCGTVGTAKEEVFWVQDPYVLDVEDRSSKKWLHEGCEEELARDA